MNTITLKDVFDSISETYNFTGRKVIFLNTGDISRGQILHSNYKDPNILPGQAKKSIKTNDILFSEIRPKNGRYALLNNTDYSDYVVSTKLMVLRKKRNDIDLDYIYLYLTSPDVIQRLQQIAEARSGTFPQITYDELDQIELKLIEKKEQKKIASRIKFFDQKIELNQKINDTLEEMGQLLFRHWFVDFEFPWDFKKNEFSWNSKPYKSSGGEMVDSELGQIPKGWGVDGVLKIIEKLSIPYKCVKSDLNKNGNTPILDQGDSGLYGHTTRKPDFFASTEKPVVIFTNHTCNFWFVDYSFCAIQNVIPLRGKSGYDEFFIYYFVNKSISFSEYKGHWPEFEAKNFVIPPSEISNKFSNISKSLLLNITFNKRQNKILSEIRDLLLPRLMSGKLRIPIKK